jgi:hypothetical protein
MREEGLANRQRVDAATPAQDRYIAEAPDSQTGARAFAQADASAKMASAGSVAEAEQFAERRLQALSRDESRPVKRAGSKVFRLVNQVWVDVTHVDSLSIIEVAPYSDAYFALARALPELSQYFMVGDEILLAGKRGSIRITADGLKTWQGGQLARVVQLYRGQ